MSRPDGFYWIRVDDHREVAQLRNGEWLQPGDERGIDYGHPDVTVISGRLREPGERLGLDELGQQLVFLARINGYALGYELEDLEAKAKKRPEPAR